MKRRLKKNQVVVTALAVMVAVAGYLNYSGMEFGRKQLPLERTEETAEAGTVNTSLIDIPSLDEDVSSVEETGEISVASDGAEAENGAGEENTDTPGEAVLTSVTAGSTFAAEAKLTREQVRAKNKETLLEVINNDSISTDQKRYALDSMNAMVDAAEELLQNSFWIPRVFWMQWSVFLTEPQMLSSTKPRSVRQSGHRSRTLSSVKRTFPVKISSSLRDSLRKESR